MCNYTKKDDSKCAREPMSDRGLCILHEDWGHKSEQETEEAFYRQIEDGKRDFEGCILPSVDLSGKEFEYDLCFRKIMVKGDANLNNAKIMGNLDFDDALIHGRVSFCKTSIGRTLYFQGAKIEKSAVFDEAVIGSDALFTETNIGGTASFWNTVIKGGL